MRINDIQTAVIEANYDYTIVRLTTDAGLIGYGECFFAPGLTAFIREIRPLVVGQDPRRVEPLGRMIRTAGVAAGLLGGMVGNAQAGIEAALYDIIGQSLGVPIHQLFGGAYRKRIRLYADCHAGDGLASLSGVIVPRVPWWMSPTGRTEHAWEVHAKFHGGQAKEAAEVDPAAYGRRAAQVAAMGYTALKFDVDVPNPFSRDDFNRCLDSREIRLMAELVAAVRRAVPEGVDLAVDCHWNFNAESCLRLAQALEPHGLMWLEDPTPPDSLEALARVCAASRVPVATGENHYHRTQFLDLIQRGGIHLAAPDFQKTGLGEGRRICELAEAFSVAVAPHNISSPIGTLASAHLCAALPNFLVLEHHGIEVPFWENLAAGGDGPVIRDGHIELSDRPGLGIRLDEAVAFKHRRREEAFFERPPDA